MIRLSRHHGTSYSEVQSFEAVPLCQETESELAFRTEDLAFNFPHPQPVFCAMLAVVPFGMCVG